MNGWPDSYTPRPRPTGPVRPLGFHSGPWASLGGRLNYRGWDEAERFLDLDRMLKSERDEYESRVLAEEERKAAQREDFRRRYS